MHQAILFGLVLLSGPATLAVVVAGAIGLELIILRLIAADSRLASGLRLAWYAETWVILCLICWRLPFREHALADSPRPSRAPGLLFIHGFMCNRAIWNGWFCALRKQDRAYVGISLRGIWRPIEAHVAQVEEAVRHLERATGQPPVLICHSMGGLIARAWAAAQAPTRRVRVVTLGTPHGGTLLANFLVGSNVKQMQTQSEWLHQLRTAECNRESATEFLCWYSDTDNVIYPANSAVLPGAEAHRVHGMGHSQLAMDERVRRAVLARLDAISNTKA